MAHCKWMGSLDMKEYYDDSPPLTAYMILFATMVVVGTAVANMMEWLGWSPFVCNVIYGALITQFTIENWGLMKEQEKLEEILSEERQNHNDAIKNQSTEFFKKIKQLENVIKTSKTIHISDEKIYTICKDTQILYIISKKKKSHQNNLLKLKRFHSESSMDTII